MVTSGLRCARKFLHSYDCKCGVVPLHVISGLVQVVVAPVLSRLYLDKASTYLDSTVAERDDSIGRISSSQWFYFEARLAEKRVFEFAKNALLSFVSFHSG